MDKIPEDLSLIRIFTNCKWNPRNLGQIDIVLGYYDKNDKQNKITVLVECKSRLFDIRQAYKQVSWQNINKNEKKILNTSEGPIKIDNNTQHFIITTLPEHNFQFPIESKLKEILDRNTKNIPIKQIISEDLYTLVKQRLCDELSPLAWMRQNDSQRIIVMRPQKQ